MATAERIDICKLFEEEYCFEVPSYQRGYRWETSHITKLLEDFIKFNNQLENAKTAADRYCLQPILVKAIDEKPYLLIDGQQRLTSLWILKGLHYALNESGSKPWQNISITFVGKDYYTQLFQQVQAVFCSEHHYGNINKLQQGIEALRTGAFAYGEKVDADHFFDNILALLTFHSNGATIKEVLLDLFRKKSSGDSLTKHIEMIWYQLDPEEKEIDAFTNINANKIPLTESELIKAHFLYKFSHREQKPENIHPQSFGDQWEQLEQKLGKADYWYFLNADGSSETGTNIDLLFQIWCNSKQLSLDPKSDYPMFDAIEKHIANNQDADTAQEIWNDILKTEGFLHDWYNDFFYYHAIGLLILLKTETAANILNDLCCEYQRTRKSSGICIYTKDTFREELRSQLQATFFNITKTQLSQLPEYLMRLDYESDKKVIRKILLTYNIAAIVNAQCEYERFPYAQFLKTDNDIEHLNPQIRTQETEDLIPLLKIYAPEKLGADVNSLSAEEISLYQELLKEKAVTYATHSLGNLVLLDSNTNRSPEYRDLRFADKTQVIKDILRNGKRSGAGDEKTVYIPVATKWVFLKAFSEQAGGVDVSQTIDPDGHWRGHDIYLADMANTITAFLAPTNQGD